MPEKGDLINTHNYLDIVFRLLYEDAIQDLRNGITFMNFPDIKTLSVKEFRKRIREAQIKLYEPLSLSCIEVVEGASCLSFRLATEKKRFIDWRISKKLLPGSLVILSHDNFRTLFVGLLKNRDADIMN